MQQVHTCVWEVQNLFKIHLIKGIKVNTDESAKVRTLNEMFPFQLPFGNSVIMKSWWVQPHYCQVAAVSTLSKAFDQQQL